MTEKLDRHELPIQSIDDIVTAIVPVHLNVMKLPTRIKTDFSLIDKAIEVVKPWYNEDMDYYIGMLNQKGNRLPHLKGYEKFRDDWSLDAEQDGQFPSLLWRENGETHSMKFNPAHVILHNRQDGSRGFYTPESWRRNKFVEIIYKDTEEVMAVAMSPEKMRKYGKETNLVQIHEDLGFAEVVANVFSSEAHENMAKTLLLRNFAVFYVNRLLEKTT